MPLLRPTPGPYSDEKESKHFDKETGSECVSFAENASPPEGKSLRRAFESLVTAFEECGINYSIIGGLALIHHGLVRATEDVNALISITQLGLPRLFESLQDRGFTVDVQKAVTELRKDGCTAIQYADVSVDLIAPVIPAYAHVLDRAMTADVLGKKVRICSAEGLVLLKLISFRSQDEADIQAILAAYAAQLDLAFVRNELDAIFDDNEPRRTKFEGWVREATQYS